MAKKCHIRQTLTARRLTALLGWGLLGLGSTLATGCSHTPVAATPPPADPLYGNRDVPTIPQPTGAPKATATSSNQQWGTPGNLSSTNTATLAGMSGGSPLGRPLALDDNGRTSAPGQLMSNPGAPNPNSTPKVEPVPDARPAVPTVTPTGNWQTPGTVQPAVQAIPAVSAEALSKQLQDRGVINPRQEVTAEGLRLTCYVPAGPSSVRELEVIAPDYVSAAQAILRQLDAAR